MIDKTEFAWKTVAAILALCISASPRNPTNTPLSPSPAFLEYWKSGLAELSSYAVTTERYGEMRPGQGVLVFVYEEIDADTRIKVETGKTPAARRVPVLKLNNTLKFTTGVYDYSVMTSVFAGLSGPGVGRPFEPRKISFSSQEWCGNVFHQIIPKASGLVSDIRSYFEAEGDAVTTLPYPAGPVFYQDEMPILLRELDGVFLKAGESMRINLVPGLWERRKRHVPLDFTKALLAKVGTESIKAGKEEKTAVKWTLESMGVTTVYHVEASMPHRLLAWENTRGEKGVLIKSLRSTYWERNHNSDEPLRSKLGLTYGAGEN
jgi:hypothetical protein